MIIRIHQYRSQSQELLNVLEGVLMLAMPVSLDTPSMKGNIVESPQESLMHLLLRWEETYHKCTL